MLKMDVHILIVEGDGIASQAQLRGAVQDLARGGKFASVTGARQVFFVGANLASWWVQTVEEGRERVRPLAVDADGAILRRDFHEYERMGVGSDPSMSMNSDHASVTIAPSTFAAA